MMCFSLGNNAFVIYEQNIDWTTTLRPGIGENIQPLDCSLQPDTADLHSYVNILDSGLVTCGGGQLMWANR